MGKVCAFCGFPTNNWRLSGGDVICHYCIADFDFDVDRRQIPKNKKKRD